MRLFKRFLMAWWLVLPSAHPGLANLPPSLPTPSLARSPIVAQSSAPRSNEATNLLQRGVEQYGANQFKLAEQSFQQALQLYRQQNDRSGQWFALYFLGLMYTSTQDFTQGNAALQQSVKIAEEIGDRGKQADSWFSLSNAANSMGNPKQAIDYSERSLQAAKAAGDTKRQANALSALSQLYTQQKDTTNAQKYAQQLAALTREKPIDDPSTQITQAIQKGQQLEQPKTRTGLEQAIQQYEQARSLAQTHKLTKLEATALLSLGTAYSQLGQKQRAIDYAQQALQTIRASDPGSIFEATALLSLASDKSDLGDLPAALDLYNQALPILQKLGFRSGEATVINNLGSVQVKLGNFRQGIDFYTRALKLSQELGDQGRQANTLNNLGLVYANLGLYQKSIDFHTQSLELNRRLNDRIQQATNLSNVGTVYSYLGQQPKALEYYNQALELLKDAGDPTQEAYTLSNIGTAYSFQNDDRKAISYYEQALQRVRQVGDRSGEASLLNNLGQSYATLGNNAQALNYYNQSLALARTVGNRAQEATVQVQLANLDYANRQYDRAAKTIAQSLVVLREVGDRRSEGVALRALGRVLLAANKLSESEARLRESVQVLESIRADLGSNDLNKVSIFDEQAATYRLLQQTLVQQNKPAAALEIAERGRARAFVELLSSRLSTSPNPVSSVTPIDLAKIQQIAKTQNATLVQYSILYDELNPAQASRIAPLHQMMTMFNGLGGTGRSLTGAELSAGLQAETTLLIWVIKPSGEVTLRQTDLRFLQKEQRSLSDLVSATRQATGVRGIGVVADASGGSDRPLSRGGPDPNAQLRQLHQLLIAPIADLLPTNPNDQVILMPQGPLFLVPFAALQNQTGKYLIQQHTLRISPAIQVLDLTRQQQIARSRSSLSSPTPFGRAALVVGNPTMPRVQLAAGEPPLPLPGLPGADREANTIAALLQTQALTGDRATKSAVLQRIQQADVIHLATHGLLNDFKGLGVPGAIALSPTDGSNGLLTADEILDLKLNANLVVLSACDTGRGRITGDGVIGLSRSFITAGVPSLVVSLWAVGDAPTAFLMQEFYQMLKQQPDRAQALRQAMLTTLQQYPNPRDWAAFVLIGEAQ